MITGLALINEIEDRLGWRQSATIEGELSPETRKLLRLLNRVIASMQSLDDWPLLRTDGTIQLVPALTGTADNAYVQNGVDFFAVGTSDSLSFNQSFVGRAIQLGDEATIYRIVAVPQSNQIKLNRPWTGDNQRTGELTYKIAQDTYQLPQDFDRPTGSWANFFGTAGIEPIGPNEFQDRRRGRNNALMIGDPDVYTIYGMDDSETFQLVHFDYFPEEARVLEFTYQRNHPTIDTDQDRILFPKTHESVVLEAVLQMALRDYEDSDKAQFVLQDLIRTLNQAQASGNVSHDRLALSPSGQHRISQHSRWRGGMRVDWGTAFDDANKTGFY